MTAIQRLIWLQLVFIVLWLPTSAQPTAIETGMSIEANIDSTAIHSYSWSVLESTVASVRVEALDSSLDPSIRIIDSSGLVIVMNDDLNYPNDTSAIVQTFVAPRTDTYTLEVSAFGATSGDYILSILRGYDRFITQDTQVSASNWSVGNQRIFTTTPVNDSLFVEAEGISEVGTLIANHFPQHSDFYFDASFRDINASSAWQVGIIFRQVSPTSYYRLVINDQGFWQLEYVGDEVAVIQSWSTHPAIVPGVPEFTLGVLTSNASIGVVYNGQLIDTVYDSRILDAGAVGVTSTTANALNSRVTFSLDSALLTTPSLSDGRLQFPEMLIGQNLTAYTLLLERQQVIPVGGELRFTSPQTLIRNNEPGVSRFTAASGVDFSEFVMGGELTISTVENGVGGCGITFHETEENHYTLAYVNTAGEYGVSRRTGDTFESGIYNTVSIRDDDTHDVVVVVLDDILYLYMDTVHVGTMPYTSMMGEIGTAVVNFDGVDTSCTIDDLWLWSLDNIES